jgi:ubiquinone/menaquinone biosynthesis C-methylase UbiE
MSDHSLPLDYDRLAADYARHRQVHPGVLRSLAAATVASRFLEVGCGTGNYLLALYDLTGRTGIGLDPSREMLGRARHRDGGAPLVRARAESMPFADGSFDLVFSVDVIHHISDRSGFFGEARRVLRRGGLCCTVTDSADDIRRRSPLSLYFPETVEMELVRYPAIEVLRQEIADAGLATLDTTFVELEYELTDLSPYRDRAFSSLHLISAEAVARGVARMAADLARGPIAARSLYTLVWGRRPS